MLLPWVTALLSASALASPPIKATIDLGKSWGQPSFALRFIESLALTSPEALFQFLSRLSDSQSIRSTDRQVYDSYLSIAQSTQLSQTELSLVKFSLALQEATPRIQAAWSWYFDSALNETSSLCNGQDWIDFAGTVLCSIQDLDPSSVRTVQAYTPLPFDHEFKNPHFELQDANTLPVAILYASPFSPTFLQFHSHLISLATSTEEVPAKIKYVLRWKPENLAPTKRLTLSNWGASLRLKKSDYLAIDDRQLEEGDSPSSVEEGSNHTTIRSMKVHELYDAGIRTAQYVLSAQDPLEALQSMSQDFLINFHTLPHSSEVSEGLEGELAYNQHTVYDGGRNAFWLNGIQWNEKEVDGFSIIRSIRRELSLVTSLTNISLSPPQALQAITHPALAEAASSAASTQNSGFLSVESLGELFDFTDRNEGGDLILWWNDLERDKKYGQWSKSVMTLLRPTYPGQMSQISRNLINVVLVLDLANIENIKIIGEVVPTVIQRGFPIRIGLVPAVHTGEGTDISDDVARIVWYLVDYIGRAKTVEYLSSLAKLEVEVLTEDVVRNHFDTYFKKKSQNDGDPMLTFKEVTSPDSIPGAEGELKLLQAKKYAKRLGVGLTEEKDIRGDVFINGKHSQMDDEWLRRLQETALMHNQYLMQQVYLKRLGDDVVASHYFANLPSTFKRRNEAVFPSSVRPLKVVDLVKTTLGLNTILRETNFLVPAKQAQTGSLLTNVTLWIVGDFDTDKAKDLLKEALVYLQEQDSRVRLSLIHNPSIAHYQRPQHPSSVVLQALTNFNRDTPEDVLAALNLLSEGYGQDSNTETSARHELLSESTSQTWRREHAEFANRAGFLPGDSGIIINGRVLNNIDASEIQATDFDILVGYETKARILPAIMALNNSIPESNHERANVIAAATSIFALAYQPETDEGMFATTLTGRQRFFDMLNGNHTSFEAGSPSSDALIEIVMLLDPLCESAQRWASILKVIRNISGVHIKVFLNPIDGLSTLPVRRFYRYTIDSQPQFTEDGWEASPGVQFDDMPEDALMTFNLEAHPSWLAFAKTTVHDLDNILLKDLRGPSRARGVVAVFELENIVVEGHARDVPSGHPPRGLQLELSRKSEKVDTIVMANLGYFQLKANPGMWNLNIRQGRSSEIYTLDSVGIGGWSSDPVSKVGNNLILMTFEGSTIYPRFRRKKGMEKARLVELPEDPKSAEEAGRDILKGAQKFMSSIFGGKKKVPKKGSGADINVFTVASGHLYERMAFIMIKSVLTHTKSSVKFWFIQNFLSPSFKAFIPHMAKEYGFEYELVTFKWPHWLREQTEKQRTIWGYKILFLDVLFPLDVDRIIFVDSDQIVRADLKELAELDLNGAPYAYAPMGDSRPEIEGFRFWKGGYWADTLKGKPYHISALYVIDLDRFRQLAAGDKLRGQYQALSSDPNSLANLDQDLPNVMQDHLPIYTLDQDWLWCETWCSDASLKTAKTIDLCNNPMTHEPKLARAKRLIPEWTIYDDEIAALAKRIKAESKDVDDNLGSVVVSADSLGQAKLQEEEQQEFVGESKTASTDEVEQEKEDHGYHKDEL